MTLTCQRLCFANTNGLSRFIASTHNSRYASGLSPVHIILDMPAVYRQYAQFSICQWFISVYRQCTQFSICQRFISVYRQYAQFSICQRFISVYRQFVFLSGACATTDVGRTFRREFTLVREVRNTAVSRRLRKTDWCFYSVFVQPHFRFFYPNPIPQERLNEA